MDTYGIIGYPLEHSFSRSYFNEKFENEGIDAQYLNFEIANIAELPQILAEHPELKGFNVTSPYKEQVLLFLDEMDKDALAIGAVNVVKIVPQKGGNNKLVGYNSDCYYHNLKTSKQAYTSNHQTRDKMFLKRKTIRLSSFLPYNSTHLICAR